ncbi:hypothetical protein [Methylocystis sp. Sn-Cys]|uniref:hypothetical protein n=1 Tax=Methylocystis sp. Sn-Cys TaxID=1701263 RepID=UPI001922179C|nr:hypothetical protein [Methylocystis sp. Sn-Cys]MBL1256935.1 hypothetical protein [Methylocystis sp. Sn-Cys]
MKNFPGFEVIDGALSIRASKRQAWRSAAMAEHLSIFIDRDRYDGIGQKYSVAVQQAYFPGPTIRERDFFRDGEVRRMRLHPAHL